MVVDDSAAHKDTLPGFHSWYRRKLQSYQGSSWFVFCGRLNKCKINCKWSLMCVCEVGSSFKHYVYAHKLALADWNEGDKL